MASVTNDRVYDTTTTTGTGAVTVSGTAPSGYRTFSSVCATNDTFYYCISHQSADEWEVGLGTYTAANEITRTTILESSNGDAVVDFSAGDKDVFITLPGSLSPVKRFGGLRAFTDLPESPGFAQFHVSTTGSDSNPGTAALPFATISKAIETACLVDADYPGATVYIIVANGTYNESATKQFFGRGMSPFIYVYGDSYDRTLVTWNLGVRQMLFYNVNIEIDAITISNSNANTPVFFDRQSVVYLYDIDFTSTGNTAAPVSIRGGSIATLDTLEFTGDMQAAILLSGGTAATLTGSYTITSAPSYTTGFISVQGGSVATLSATFSGSATGPKWSIDAASRFGGANSPRTLPGSTLGQTVAREVLSANRTYYIRTDGSDSNTGLANTSAGAWLTLTHAWNWISANLDIGAYTVTIQFADGTYTDNPYLTAPQTGIVKFKGNTTTPANVIMSGTSPFSLIGQPFEVQIEGFHCTGYNPIYLSQGTKVRITGAMRFVPSAGGYFTYLDGGNAFLIVNYAVSMYAAGTMDALHWLVSGTKLVDYGTWTFSTVTVSYYTLIADGNCQITWGAPSVTGTPTGRKYLATYNSVVTGSVPGSLAGIVQTGAMTADVGHREVLKANRTYYVRTDGNNSNNGLSNTSGGAWATVQYAWDWIAANIDIGSYTVTIQVADGTYNGGVTLNAPQTGRVSIEGNSGTPANVVFNLNAAYATFQISKQNYEVWIDGFEIRANHALVGVLLNIIDADVTHVSAMRFNTVTAASYVSGIIVAGRTAQFTAASTNITIVGNYGQFIYTYDRPKVTFQPYLYLNTNVWGDAFMWLTDNTFFNLWHAVSSGTSTGKRYILEGQSVVQQGDTALVPGDLPGSVSGGSVFNRLHAARDVLTANRTYYVSTTGSNSNDGLSSGKAWLTLQYAWDWIAANLDIGAYQVTIQLADGNYAGLDAVAPQTGAIQIRGNTTTAASVNFNSGGGSIGRLSFTNQPNPVYVGGVQMERGTDGSCLYAYNSIVRLDEDVVFKRTAGTVNAIRARGNRAQVYCDAYSMTFDGAFARALYAEEGARIDWFSNGVTLTSNSYSVAFAVATSVSQIGATYGSLTGLATGLYYDVTQNSVIDTYGAGGTYLPGDTAGTTATGGQYL